MNPDVVHAHCPLNSSVLKLDFVAFGACLIRLVFFTDRLLDSLGDALVGKGTSVGLECVLLSEH